MKASRGKIVGLDWNHLQNYLPKLFLVTLLYLLTGKFNSYVGIEGATFSAAWLPTGVAIGFIYLWGYRMCPAIFLGAIPTIMTAFARLPVGRGILMGMFVGIGNMLEAVIAVYLIRKFTKGRNPLRSAQDLFLFLIFGGLIGPMVSATWGVTLGLSTGAYFLGNYWASWLSWVLENMNGVFLIATLIIAWGTEPLPRFQDYKKVVEGIVLTVLLILTSELIFGSLANVWLKRYPLEYLCTPILIWAAFRFGLRGVASANVVLFLVATLELRQGHGPFFGLATAESLHLLQLYIGTNALLTLCVASVLYERKTYEQRLIRSNSELEKFAYLASHDLQEPLRTISNFSGLMEMQLKDSKDPELIQSLSYIKDASVRATQLIQSVLEYSRVTYGVEIRPVDCNEIFDRVMANLQGSINENKAEITYDRFPQVAGDSALLTILFQNLLANAIRFRGNMPPRISISVRNCHTLWEFAFADNGIGIDPRQSGRIFDLFHRAHPAEVARAGTGISLAVCRKIVMELGGKIWVKSAPNYGSTFFFTLPSVSA